MFYIIVNGSKLKGKKLKYIDNVKSIFERAGHEYEVLVTERKGQAKEYAESITSGEGGHSLIAMGGDGTLHEILNGIKNFDNNSLGLIPIGTGNDFAESAGIPHDCKQAADIIAFHSPQYVDFIELDSGLRSLNAAGMGIDVDVLQRTYSGKRHGRSKYFRSLIASLIKYKSREFTVEYDGKSESHNGIIAALGNGKQIGGGIKLFPDAEINDGYLDLIIVDYISRPKMLAAMFKLVRGKVNKIKEATALRVKEAKITSSDENFIIQAEGELYENVPLAAHVVSNKLKFYL